MTGTNEIRLTPDFVNTDIPFFHCYFHPDNEDLEGTMDKQDRGYLGLLNTI